MEKIDQAVAEFRLRATSPGESDWTKKDDKLLTVVARKYEVTEDELFGALHDPVPVDELDAPPILAISPGQYDSIWGLLQPPRSNGRSRG